MGTYLTFLSDPQLSKRIRSYLTPDLKAGLMNIYLNPSLPKEEKSKVVEVARGKLGTVENFSVGLAGSYTMERDIGKLMERDNRVLIPATIVFVLVVLFLTFRRFSDVGRCLLVVGLATLWTHGGDGFHELGLHRHPCGPHPHLHGGRNRLLPLLPLPVLRREREGEGNRGIPEHLRG
jgi:predicted RND superfamily exporter protein